MPDLKISQLPAATTPLAGTELVPIVQSGTTDKVTVADLTAGRAVSASALTASSGNLTFSGTAQRITGDFSNATLANRLMFQTSTANGNTNVNAIPNGTGIQSAFTVRNSSDIANSSSTQLYVDATRSTIIAGAIGTGTFLPMTFDTSGSERMRIDTSGNVGIGTASPSSRLDVSGSGTQTVRSATVDTSGAAVGRFRAVYTGGGGGAASAVDLRAGDGYTYLLTETNSPLLFGTNAAERLRIDASGNVVQNTAAVATNATAGFLWITSCAGAPTGAPTAPYTNAAALVCDTTNNRLYVRVGSTWRYATLT